MQDSDAAWFRAKIVSALGRMVSVEEQVRAMGMKNANFYEQSKEGRLINPERVITAAENLGINPVRLLVDCEFITWGDVEEYYIDHFPPGSHEIRREM